MNQARPLFTALRRGLRSRRLGAPVALALGAALVCGVLAAPQTHGPAGTSPEPASPKTVVASLGSEIRTYVAVGDSITAGMVQATDSLETPGPTSCLRGGGAAGLAGGGGGPPPGRVPGDLRAHMPPPPADVLVLLGGTNDLARGVPWAETVANLRGIVATVGA